MIFFQYAERAFYLNGAIDSQQDSFRTRNILPGLGSLLPKFLRDAELAVPFCFRTQRFVRALAAVFTLVNRNQTAIAGF